MVNMGCYGYDLRLQEEKIKSRIGYLSQCKGAVSQTLGVIIEVIATTSVVSQKL